MPLVLMPNTVLSPDQIANKVITFEKLHDFIVALILLNI